MNGGGWRDGTVDGGEERGAGKRKGKEMSLTEHSQIGKACDISCTVGDSALVPACIVPANLGNDKVVSTLYHTTGQGQVPKQTPEHSCLSAGVAPKTGSLSFPDCERHWNNRHCGKICGQRRQTHRM